MRTQQRQYSVIGPPGLLQTAAYAREALAADGLKGDELDQQVEARTGRRRVDEPSKAERFHRTCDAVRDLALPSAESQKLILGMSEEVPCEPST